MVGIPHMFTNERGGHPFKYVYKQASFSLVTTETGVAFVSLPFLWHVYHFMYDGKWSATETNSASHHTPLRSLWLYKQPLPTLLNHSHYLDLQLRHILLNYPKVNLRVTIQYFTEWLTASYALVNLVLRSCPAFCHLQFLFFM